MDHRSQAFFLQAGSGQVGQRFCVLDEPARGDVAACAVHVHAFGEEMNKSRRMVALQSRALAKHGVAVLRIDLMGCGDSSGDFGDARWEDWIADVRLAADWLTKRHPVPLWLWGLRAGCLLASATDLGRPVQHLFWQPPASGASLLQQFLRLRLVADLSAANTQARSSVSELRAELAAGRSLDVAGYRLSSAVALGLEKATLAPPARSGRSIWLETSTREEPQALPATVSASQAWLRAGHDVQVHAVRGPAFWQTQEIEDAPALLDATIDMLCPALEPT